METKTLVLMNMVGHLIVVVFMFAYNRNHLTRTSRDHFLSQLFFAFAFTCFSISYIPGITYTLDMLLTLFGNGAMFFGATYILLTAISFSNNYTHIIKLRVFMLTGTILSIASILAIIPGYSNVRIAVVTLFVAYCFAASSAVLLVSKLKSELQRVIGVMFMLVAFAHLYRVVEALDLSRLYVMDTPGLGQSLTMMSMFVFMILSGSGLVMLTKENADDKLYKAATFDGLTGVYNRQSFVKMINEVQQNQTPPRYKAIVMVDLDHFKKLNDTHGHHWGDQVLIYLTQILNASKGPQDFIGRFGGDEFILFMQDESKEAVIARCEIMRNALSSVPYDGVPLSATFGIAIADYEKDPLPRHFDVFSKTADEALYKGKLFGKNTLYTDSL